MSKKILFTASTKSHFDHFHLPYFKAFEDLGWEVTPFVLPVSKSFFSIKNMAAINETRKLIKKEKFDIISSQSTLAGIVTRFAVMLTGRHRKRMKVFHTAHGYLFHDDKSLKKWAYLLPEMLCAKVTDVLMVMNHEDLEIARKYKLCKNTENIHYIDGMGIDLSRFQTAQGEPLQCTKEQKTAFGIKENDFVFVYAAEFSKRKNHELLLRGFAEAIQEIDRLVIDGENGKAEEAVAKHLAGSELEIQVKSNKKNNLKLVLAGDGALLEKMRGLAAELGIKNHVIFLGYIKNMNELYPCCDVAVSTSRIEGLPFNIMEAMASGLPVIASDIKGHKELTTHGENGLLFESENLEELTDQIIKMYITTGFRERCRSISLEKVKLFSLDRVFPDIMKVYKNNE